MKIYAAKYILAVTLMVVTQWSFAAEAREFDGAYAGGKIGLNRTDITAVSTQSSLVAGLEGGYNWSVGGMLLGLGGFVDINSAKSHAGVAPAPGIVNYGSHVYGLDLKLGLPKGDWLPYAKLGYAHIGGRGDVYASVVNDNRAHLGLGIEYKFSPSWAIAGEWTNSFGKSTAATLNNNNFTLGLNYYFDKHNVATPAPAPAPVARREEPQVAAPVAPNETWKTLLENKPVCIEGTNFEFDSAKLRSRAIKKLDEVASFAEKYKDAQLEASGHTCNIGNESYNQRLSERRAQSVKDYLVKNGVAEGRIVTVGYGESRPMADNETPSGREQNRRVEICTVLAVERRVRVTK